MFANRLSAAAALLITTAPAALAEVTAADVWADWVANAEAAGQTVTAESEEQSGDTLTIGGATFSSTTDEGSFVSRIDEIVMRETGDGTVEITSSPNYALTLSFKNDEGQPVEIVLDVAQQNMAMVAGGEPGATSYDFTADAVTITAVSVTEAGNVLPFEAAASLEGMQGSYLVSDGENGMKDFSSAVGAGTFSFKMGFTDDAAGSALQADMTASQFSVETNGALAPLELMEKFDEALRAGFATDLALSYGPASYKLDVTENGTPTNIAGSADSGRFAFAVDKSRMAYQGGGTNVKINVAGGQLPVPEVSLSYAETVFDFLMPLTAAPEPQPFNFTAKIMDLVVPDIAWQMFDPAGNLPRDPATLVIDAKGTATLTQDITSEQAMNSGAPPGTLESIDIPEIRLKAVGAELTGDGSLTFDNTDLTTFNGMPAPTGTINLMLVGGNALLDKLAAMGIVPEDQVMGARMMMGMFAKPGDGPDTLTSTLEFKDKGFYANGMRLQ